MSFFAARLPAIASAGMMNINRAISIAMANVRLYQGVLALIPAKALPLLPDALLYAYRISEKPWGPPLFRFPVDGPYEPFQYAPFSNGAIELKAVKPSTHTDVAIIAMIAILTSFCSIFLPTYSGVRPTMRPPMKTATTA